MNQNDPGQWPPIIEFARAPWLVRVRDIVLTIAAWVLLLYLLIDALVLLIGAFIYPLSELTSNHAPDWLGLWHRLDAFLYWSLAGMLWVTFWGIINRRRLRHAALFTPPPPLPLEEHAATFQLDPGIVERWREMKVVVIQFDSDHRIVSDTAASAESSSEDASVRQEHR